jgi:hypothetical protein
MDALYEFREDGVFATEYTRGPWDPRHQHGGAPAALLMRAFEALEPDPGLQIVRVTYELMRPVPLGDLAVTVEIVRPGRRVQLLEGTIVTPDGIEVLRARALRVRRAPVSSGAELSHDAKAFAAAGGAVAAPATGPGGIAPSGFPSDGTLFPGDGIEIRYVAGGFFDLGPATAWFRLRVPIVAGETPSPLQRMAAAADFPNGMSTELDWSRYVFINPDLTLYVEREPVGEWLALTGAMRTVEGGAGVAQAVLFDERGRIGRSLQSLYVAEREA